MLEMMAHNFDAGLPAGLPVTFWRVVRGGSWINNQDNARASYRNNNRPDNRNNNIGFRVCCVSHIDPCSSSVQAFFAVQVMPALQSIIASGIVRRPRFANRSEELIDGAG
jgi:hypothetical protein